MQFPRIKMHKGRHCFSIRGGGCPGGCALIVFSFNLCKMSGGDSLLFKKGAKR